MAQFIKGGSMKDRVNNIVTSDITYKIIFYEYRINNAFLLECTLETTLRAQQKLANIVSSIYQPIY